MPSVHYQYTTTMRSSLLSLILLCFTFANAQTYFYIGQIAVQPQAPTENDAITIDLIGDLSSTGASVASATASVSGQVVTLAVTAIDVGGLTVIVPHTETISLGQLAAGDYTIVIDGTNTDDLAPVEQHAFTVTGGGDLAACDSLELLSIQWHPFADTAVVVRVGNTSSELFDYPNFILFNNEGDTLAIENTNFFGISQDSWHVLRIVDNATLPSAPFTGTLELWTGFTTSLACSWELSIDLCPSQECVTVYPQLQNQGGGLPIGTYDWSITGQNGASAGSGVFELSAEFELDTDTICLVPGTYTMSVTPNQQPMGGAPFYSITAEGGLSSAALPVYTLITEPLIFEFLLPCADGANSVIDQPSGSHFNVQQRERTLLISFPNGQSMGSVELFDTQGRQVYQTVSNSNTVTIDLGADPSGIYLVRTRNATQRILVL